MSSAPRPHEHEAVLPPTIDVNELQPSQARTVTDTRLGQHFGKCKLIRLLGAGGMGAVYLAEDSLLARQVAIKLISDKFSCHSEVVRRFQREAQLASQLNHPNVVTIYHADQEGGTWYLVMELVSGGSAQDLVRRGGALSWKEATQLIRDACQGLVAAHKAGLIHRDIKPANLLRTKDGVGKLADFGLARVFGRTVSPMTKDGEVFGTPDYMSPEQCKGLNLDERSDLYSLGATYYTLLTGQLPYPKTEPMQVMFAHCSEPWPDPRTANPSVPVECADIVHRATAKERNERYVSADEMLIDLQAILGERAAADTQPVKFIAPKKRIRRKWPRLAVLGLVILLGAMLLYGVGWRATRKNLPDHDPVSPGQPLKLTLRKSYPSGQVGARMVRWSRNGELLAAACADHKIRIWLPATDEERIFTGHTDKVLSVAFGPTGDTLFSSSNDKTIRYWDLGTGHCMATLRADDIVYELSFSPNGRLLVGACCYDGFTVWGYDASPEIDVIKHRRLNGMLQSARFSADGKKLLLAPGKSVCTYNVGTYEIADQIDESAEVWEAAYLPNGKSIVYVTFDGFVKIWEPGSNSKPSVLLSSANPPAFRCLALSSDGGTLAVAGAWGGGIQLYHFATGKTTRFGVGHPGAVRWLDFSPNGKFLAATIEIVNVLDVKGEVQLWDVHQEEPPPPPRGQP
jgi:WD40 repeat protein